VAVAHAEANGRSATVLPEDIGKPAARALLEAAVVQFAERGYHGVSVRDLTNAVGIKSASFYAHFPSKEALLAELIIGGHEAHQAAVRDGLLSAGPSPAEQMRGAITANVAFQATWPLVTIVANTELHALSAENRERVLAIRHDTGVLIVAVIERGRDTGVFRVDDVWLATSAIGAMGIRVAWWFRPPSLRGDDSPLGEYPREAATWMPGDRYSVESVASSYADFALRVLGAT
jgi:AcrR family transcriptional regulator